MQDQSKHRKEVYTDFFRRCGFEFEELPPEALEMYKFINFRRFIEPMIKQDFDRGTMKRGSICSFYQITYNVLKNIV